MPSNKGTYTTTMKYEYNGITIRTELQPGDMGYIIYLHGRLYKQEYDYGLAFESYVVQGFYEFYNQYDPERDGVWICEDNHSIVGFLLLMHRPGNAAQLRFFILLPEHRGKGIGKKLMQLYMAWLREHHYQSAYLWTTNEQLEAAALYKKFGFRLTEEHESTTFGKPLIEQRYDLTF